MTRDATKKECLWLAEREQRLNDSELGCEWGETYLSDAIPKLLPTDLTVVGAKTGSGKTEFAAIIASHNVRLGKKVLLVALEADRYEMHQRIKYREVAKRMDSFVNFRDWKLGRLEKTVGPDVEHEVCEELKTQMANLKIITPNLATFYREKLHQLYEWAKERADLIIIDHLHYIDFKEERENSGIKKNVAEIRTLVNTYRIPTIVFSHLRKPERIGGKYSILPSLDELYGSSEISKQANHVISFGRVYEIGELQLSKPSTGFMVAKTRWAEGEGFMGLVRFNPKTKCYADSYNLFRLTNRWATDAKAVDPCDAPYWATHAVKAVEV